MAYIIIFPDPDWRHRCRHTSGDPDCACYPECPECGALYTPSEGHDCIDSELSKGDLLDIARELRDSLDACETERDRLRAELDAAHDGEDALRSEVAKLRAQLAALQSVPQGVELTEDDVRRSLMSNAIDVDVEGVTPRLNRIIVSRLAPTPPQAAPGAVVEVHPEEFRRDDRYIVLKRTDLERHATPAQLRELERTCGMVRAGRATEGKRLKSYVVVADNWPEYEETWAKIQARVTGIPQPIQPEGRRVGPDEVVVSREEWEVIEQILKASAICANEGGTDRHCCMQTDDHHIPLTRIRAIRALRTSAQAHNVEGATNAG